MFPARFASKIHDEVIMRHHFCKISSQHKSFPEVSTDLQIGTLAMFVAGDMSYLIQSLEATTTKRWTFVCT
jgi:hypothetical protein